MNTRNTQGNEPKAVLYMRDATESQLYDGKVWDTALYLRLSRDDGDKTESDSIVNQKELIRSFIKNKPDIKLIDDYEDDGWSGVDFDRPDFKRLLEDIRTGRINCVIVKDLSRLGRNYIETGKLLERFFPFMGIRFIAINDSYDSQNHNSRTDNFIIPFKNLINDAYCADTSRKIRSQFEVKRKNGEFIGSFAAFGYAKDATNRNQIVIDENVAPIVRDIFMWKIEGMSQQGIADKLNELGIPSPLEYKKASGSNYTTVFNINSKAKWTAVAVGRILKNDLYTGVLTQGISTTPNYKVKQRITKMKDEWVRIEQSHDPIISAQDFKLVTALLEKDTRIAPGGNVVCLFSGMLHCGDCGQNLVRKTVPSEKNKYIYHICSTYKKGKGCKSHRISEKALYDAVYEAVSLYITKCAKVSSILEKIEDMPLFRLDSQRLEKQIADREAEIEKINRRKVKLYEDFSDGVISKDEHVKFRDVFSMQADEADRAMGNLRQELDTILNGGGTDSPLVEHFKKYHNLPTLTRNVVVELIERIIVFESGSIEICFRFQESFDNTVRYIDSLPIETLPKDELNIEMTVSY